MSGRKNQLLFKAVKSEDVNISPDGEDFMVEGYASIFNNVDDGDDVVMPSAFTKTLNEMGDRIAMCYQHDMWNPIGKLLKCSEDTKGLYFKARISDAEPAIKTKISENILKEMSIGYQVINSHPETRQAKQVNCLDELKLYEMSLVTLAMNPLAWVRPAEMKSLFSFFGIDSIEEEFDRIISHERDHKKKFDLLKLKNIALAFSGAPVIDTTPKDDKPLMELKEAIDVLANLFKNK